LLKPLRSALSLVVFIFISFPGSSDLSPKDAGGCAGFPVYGL
jgi:hypothetical protein